MKSLVVLALLSATLQAAEPVSLFDGESLDGWTIREGEEKWWRVEKGEIVGGTLKERIPHNTFITPPGRYANFELSLDVKTEGSAKANAGIQIRSERVPDHHEMIGYQADVGAGWWGKLYDESRRRRVVGDHVDPAVAKAVKLDEWNVYRIRCVGPRIQLFVNGTKTVDYVEQDPKIPLEGLIALQTHSGEPFLVRYRNVRIKELPPTEGIPTWATLGIEGRRPWGKN